VKLQLPNLSRVDAAGAGAVAVLTVGGYFAGYAPLQAAQATQTSQRETLAQQRETLERRDDDLRKLRIAAADSKAKLSSAITLEPASRLTSRMAAFPELAELHGVVILETLPRAAVVGKQFVRVPLGVSGTGPYPAFASFLAGIAARFPDMEVVSFQISGQPEDSSQPSRFAVDLVWYTVPDGADDADNAGNAGTKTTPRK